MSEKASQFRIGIFVSRRRGDPARGALLSSASAAPFEPTYTFETYVDGQRGRALGGLGRQAARRHGRQGHRDRVQLEHVRGRASRRASSCASRSSRGSAREMFRKDFDEALDTIVADGLRAVVQTAGDHRHRASWRCRRWTRSSTRRSRFPWKPKYLYIPSAPEPARPDPGRRSTRRSRTSRSSTSGSSSGSLETTSSSSADAALKNLNRARREGDLRERDRAIDDADAAVEGDPGARRGRPDDLRSMKLDAVGEDANRLIDDLDARLSAC